MANGRAIVFVQQPDPLEDNYSIKLNFRRLPIRLSNGANDIILLCLSNKKARSVCGGVGVEQYNLVGVSEWND